MGVWWRYGCEKLILFTGNKVYLCKINYVSCCRNNSEFMYIVIHGVLCLTLGIFIQLLRINFAEILFLNSFMKLTHDAMFVWYMKEKRKWWSGVRIKMERTKFLNFNLKQSWCFKSALYVWRIESVICCSNILLLFKNCLNR